MRCRASDSTSLDDATDLLMAQSCEVWTLEHSCKSQLMHVRAEVYRRVRSIHRQFFLLTDAVAYSPRVRHAPDDIATVIRHEQRAVAPDRHRYRTAPHLVF